MKIIILFILLFSIPHGSAQVSNLEDIQQLQDFITADTTDQNEWKPYYTCGHYTRDLVKSAEKQDIFLGGALLSNNPVFRSKYDNNHIVNYIYVDNEILFIDPQTDELFHLAGIYYQWGYIRLYYNGIQTPSYWGVNLAPTMRWEDTEAERRLL